MITRCYFHTLTMKLLLSPMVVADEHILIAIIVDVADVITVQCLKRILLIEIEDNTRCQFFTAFIHSKHTKLPSDTITTMQHKSSCRVALSQRGVNRWSQSVIRVIIPIHIVYLC